MKEKKKMQSICSYTLKKK